jgi:catechol 2,3-dioxygenase-like lactoylglutathione lyase family enzyme
VETLLDHVFITVKGLDRSIAFYDTALKPLGIVHALDYDGKNGPEGHPDLKGFGRDGRVFFWLRQGDADARAAHIDSDVPDVYVRSLSLAWLRQ